MRKRYGAPAAAATRPPTSPAKLALWWGAQNGRTPDNSAVTSSPATE